MKFAVVTAAAAFGLLSPMLTPEPAPLDPTPPTHHTHDVHAAYAAH